MKRYLGQDFQLTGFTLWQALKLALSANLGYDVVVKAFVFSISYNFEVIVLAWCQYLVGNMSYPCMNFTCCRLGPLKIAAKGVMYYPLETMTY